MHKKHIIGLSLLVSMIGSVAIAQEKPLPFPDWVKKSYPPEVYQPEQKPQTYLYPDNSTKTESQLIKKTEAVKGKLKPGFKIKEQNLVKYSQFQAKRKTFSGDIIENMQVSPERLVYLTTIDAPGGFDVPDSAGKPQKFNDSEITIVTDAETGIIFDTVISEKRKK
jgi:hypothetical protein